MKLNYTRERISSWNLYLIDRLAQGDKDVEGGHGLLMTSDWLTLRAEVDAQTKLIEQLEKALKSLERVTDFHNLPTKEALDKVRAWRKEQK